jgi:hypothetical protein
MNTNELTVNDTDLAALTDAAQEIGQSDIVGLPLEYAKGRWRITISKDEYREIGAAPAAPAVPAVPTRAQQQVCDLNDEIPF